jgi:hypothetical protein
MKFLVDSMAGKLAKYLRLLGFDAEYQDVKGRKEIEDRAKREGRVVLTRDKKLARRLKEVLLLRSDMVYDQVVETLRAFNLRDEIRPFTRCIECNRELVRVKKEEVRGKVPFFVWLTRDEFSKCPSCGRFFWEGTHTRELREKIDILLAKLNEG